MQPPNVKASAASSNQYHTGIPGTTAAVPATKVSYRFAMCANNDDTTHAYAYTSISVVRGLCTCSCTSPSNLNLYLHLHLHLQ